MKLEKLSYIFELAAIKSSRMKLLYLSAFSVLTLLISCLRQDKSPQFYIDKYYNNKHKLNQLIDSLKVDTSIKDKYGVSFNPSQLSDFVQKKMIELDISDVFISASRNRQLQFDFGTKYQKPFPIHLFYNGIDSAETTMGFYKKNELGNDFWGLGDNWSLCIERKLLEGVQ